MKKLKLKQCKPSIMQHTTTPDSIRLVMSKMDEREFPWTPEKGSAAYDRMMVERDRSGGYVTPMMWTARERKALKEFRANL
jgi:hypothetical protein